jgi:predicted transcriptional regulator
MGLFSSFMKRVENGEHFIGDSGSEDDVMLAIAGQMDGATPEEILEYLEKKDSKIGKEVLQRILDALVEKGKIESRRDGGGYRLV